MDIPNKPLVAINNVSKFFNKEVSLQGITAEIPPGQIAGLVGPDGAGKTTLIRLISGLMLPSQGEIWVKGYNTFENAEEIAPLIGYMPQKFGLYEDLTVIQNLSLYANLKGVEKEQQGKEFQKLLNFTGLHPFKNRLSGALSGGMKQKLGLACALLGKPSLLLLDEPSVGVDPISRKELWKMVFDLLKEGISVLWSTAYLDEAERCNFILLLNEGRLLYCGEPKEITKRVEGRVFKLSGIQESRRALLATLLNNQSVLDGIIQGSDLRVILRQPDPTSIASDFKQEKAIQVSSATPRFEDAFIDVLGGWEGEDSALAALRPAIAKSQETVIRAVDLTKKFGDFIAANQINFQVPRGEVFGLLGPNGAGKSTTFKMLCGLLTPTSGKAEVIGLDLQEAPSAARQKIGYMAQKFSLYGDLTVRQNLNFFAGVYSLTRQERKKAIEHMVDIFNLHAYLDADAKSLPLGFKQRLALACAVMHNPEVLFLDEPTSGVDPLTRREFWIHINGLVEKGVTVMITTHFMDEAEYCDQIALVYRGQIIHTGAPNELKDLAISNKNPEPTLEDSFIELIEQYDQQHPLQ